MTGDVSSLCPTSMAGNDIFKVKFPVGFSRWSEEPEKEFNEDKYGFYEIEYIAPKNVNYPILPRRKEDGGIIWDLLPGKGVYTNVDIRNAIKVGYEIKFINKCLEYDKTRDNIFIGYTNNSII